MLVRVLGFGKARRRLRRNRNRNLSTSRSAGKRGQVMDDAWVFLDVGNVLLDEGPLTYRVFRRHVEAVRRACPEATFAGLLAEREAKAAAGSRWPLDEVVSAFLDEAGRAAVWTEAAREVRAEFARLSPPVTGALGLVERLARRYRLGLIANQGSECRARLKALGLLGRFRVVALSEERGTYKPDPGLFRWAVEQAGAAPSDCVMVGDRLDNDIAPALALGMAAVWVRWPDFSAKGWRPAEPEALAYRESLERSARRAEALAPEVRPSVAIDTIGALEEALDGLARSSLRRPE